MMNAKGTAYWALLFILTLSMGLASTSVAKEIKLKSICFLPTSTTQSKMYLELLDRINQKAKDKLKIENLGGPEVMTAVEQTDAIREGMFDIGMTAPDFYSKTMPEAQIFYYTTDTPMDQRRSGFFDIMLELHEKLNYRYLGRLDASDSFYMFLNRKVNNPRTDFKPLKIRSVEPYAVFLDALGCARVTVPRVDVYGAMEKKVIDGFLAPATLVKDTAQYEVTKYIVMPPVFQSNIIIIMNSKVFKSLPKDLQELLVKETQEYEKIGWDTSKKLSEEAVKFLLAKGKMEEVRFTAEDTKWFLEKANRLPVEEALKNSPLYGPKLLKVMGVAK